MASFRFVTKQEGYGRQGLYVCIDGNDYYLCSVFPNIPESFSEYELIEDCFGNEHDGFVDSDGKRVTPISSWDEFLTDRFKGEIGLIIYDNISCNDECFDFDNESFESIADWYLGRL